MKINVDNSTDLLQLSTDNLLIDKLQQQIEKDFILANVPLDMPLKFEPQSFVATILEKVYYLMMEHFTDYLNLLYIIDVPEKEFKHIKITDTVEVANQVTFLILKREYQKVWFRNMYK